MFKLKIITKLIVSLIFPGGRVRTNRSRNNIFSISFKYKNVYSERSENVAVVKMWLESKKLENCKSDNEETRCELFPEVMLYICNSKLDAAANWRANLMIFHTHS